jgi:hypothetical protein
MPTNTVKILASLAAKVPDYQEVEATPERHIFLLWLITRGITTLGGDRPILVGGGAVEIYTGIRFATGDLDLVAPSMIECADTLDALGYTRPSHSKHFVNRTIASLVDVHESTLYGREEAIEVVYRKVPLLIVSPEDCIAERLASYRRHGSTLDILNAFLVSYHQKDRLDANRLSERIGALDLWDLFRPVQDIIRALVCKQAGVDEAAANLIHFMKKGGRECAF